MRQRAQKAVRSFAFPKQTSPPGKLHFQQITGKFLIDLQKKSSYNENDFQKHWGAVFM
jgi:hypothetical protein